MWSHAKFWRLMEPPYNIGFYLYKLRSAGFITMVGMCYNQPLSIFILFLIISTLF